MASMSAGHFKLVEQASSLLREWRVQLEEWAVQSKECKVQRAACCPWHVSSSRSLKDIERHSRFGQGELVKTSLRHLQVTLAMHFINWTNQISLQHFFVLSFVIASMRYLFVLSIRKCGQRSNLNNFFVYNADIIISLVYVKAIKFYLFYVAYKWSWKMKLMICGDGRLKIQDSK